MRYLLMRTPIFCASLHGLPSNNLVRAVNDHIQFPGYSKHIHAEFLGSKCASHDVVCEGRMACEGRTAKASKHPGHLFKPKSQLCTLLSGAGCETAPVRRAGAVARNAALKDAAHDEAVRVEKSTDALPKPVRTHHWMAAKPQPACDDRRATLVLDRSLYVLVHMCLFICLKAALLAAHI